MIRNLRLFTWTAITTMIVFMLGLTASAQAEGLLAYWDMDEGTGSTAEDSFGANDLTLMNGPSWTTDHTGAGNAAISLDPNGSQYLIGGNVLNLNKQAPFSMAGWVYVPNTDYVLNNTMGLIGTLDNSSPYDGWGIQITGKKFQFDMTGVSSVGRLRIRSWDSLPMDQWVHLAVAYDGSDTAAGLSLYVNGSPIAFEVRDNKPGGSLATNHNFGIGGYVGAAVGRFFQGSVDDWGVWDMQISELQVNNAKNYGADQYAIPEPSTFVLLAFGIVYGLFYFRNRAK